MSHHLGDAVKTRAEELIELYGYWGEHPDYSAADWRYEVLENYTRQGYWQWVARAQELGTFAKTRG
jgi:hypothetical protein